jgi:hypothetical protein
MEIRTVRKPGDKGTQALMQQYGERLVCIRYSDSQGWRELEQCTTAWTQEVGRRRKPKPRSNCRYDPARKKRFKTVELIVAEQDWQPPEPHPDEDKAPGFAPKSYYTRRLGIRLSHLETELRKKIMAAGGMWDPAERLWFLPEEEIRKLGLVQRVVKQ